jgi:hypothetical protein
MVYLGNETIAGFIHMASPTELYRWPSAGYIRVRPLPNIVEHDEIIRQTVRELKKVKRHIYPTESIYHHLNLHFR